RVTVRPVGPYPITIARLSGSSDDDAPTSIASSSVPAPTTHFARLVAIQRSTRSIAANASGLMVIEMIATRTTMSIASAGTMLRSRPSVTRMNENSPIWDNATATVSVVRKGYFISQVTSAAVSGFPTITIANAASANAGLSITLAGRSSIPTDTKNNTANASRIGSASVAARKL